MQLHHGVVVRRVGQRQAAPYAGFGEDVDILPGEKLQALARGQTQMNHHHVGRQAFELLHAAGQRAHLNADDADDFATLDHHVGQGLGLAKEGESLFLVGIAQSGAAVVAVFDFAFEQLALANAAAAVAAGVGDVKTLAQRAVEYGFVAAHAIGAIARLDGDLAGRV